MNAEYHVKPREIGFAEKQQGSKLSNGGRREAGVSG